MSSLFHYIRIYVPLKENHKPNTTAVGHYELQLMNSNFQFEAWNIDDNINTTTPHTYSFENPVISYGPIESNNIEYGYICVTPMASTPNRSNSLLCTCPFQNVNGEDSTIKPWLKNYVRYDPMLSQSTGKKYFKVVHPDFDVYSYEDSNCFIFTGFLCNMLGYGTLKNISDTHYYTDYIAWPMFMSYKQYWALEDLNI